MKHHILLLTFYFCLISGQLFAENVNIPMDHYPPWKIALNNHAGGIDSHLIASLLYGSEFTPFYQVCPWQRCLLMMKSGQGDLISGVTLNKERSEYLIYLQPPYKIKSHKVLFVPLDKNSDFKTIKDMEHKNIGILRGARYFPEFDKNQTIVKKETNSILQGLKMVVAGRLDAFLVTKENGEYLLKENPQLKKDLVKSVWRYEQEIKVYFAISKKSKLTKRKNELEKRLKHLVDLGEIDKIIKNSLQ